MKQRVVQQMILLVVGILLLAACEPKIPQAYIQPDEMENLLYDYYVSQGLTVYPKYSGSIDYQRQYNMNLVLKKYGRTQAELDSSLKYYYVHAEDIYKIYEHVQKRLSEKALELGASTVEVERYTAQSLSGDTAEVWEGGRQMVILPQPPYNVFQFSQKADTSYHQGDSFLMTFGGTFLVQSGSKNALLVLNILYENDSIVTQTTSVSQMGTTTLRIPACNLKAKEMKGFVYMPKRQGFDNENDMCVLLLDHIQFVRFHHKAKENTLPQNAVPVVDTLRNDTLKPDSLKQHRHRLGERPMLMKPDEKKSVNKTITKE